jgi:hypothetical protein
VKLPPNPTGHNLRLAKYWLPIVFLLWAETGHPPPRVLLQRLESPRGRTPTVTFIPESHSSCSLFCRLNVARIDRIDQINKNRITGSIESSSSSIYKTISDTNTSRTILNVWNQRVLSFTTQTNQKFTRSVLFLPIE